MTVTEAVEKGVYSYSIEQLRGLNKPYTHFKGGQYLFLRIVGGTDGLYYTLYTDIDKKYLYARPTQMFIDRAMKDGVLVDRFTCGRQFYS